MKTAILNSAVACGLLLASGASGRCQSLPISTLAGQAVAGSADGSGHHARFSFPRGLAADAAGNLYLADTGNSTIRRIAPDGDVSTLAGRAGIAGAVDGSGTNALFDAPEGIAADALGNLFVADTANATIRRILPSGNVTTLAGLAGQVNSFDGTANEARFNRPQAVAADGAGNVCVADTGNHTIRFVTAAGTVSTLAGLAGYPGSVDGTNSKARFDRPAGVARDAAGNLFVTDCLNHTIRRITPDGTVSTIAGLAGVWGRADGTNRTARFFMPHGIALDGAGNLFVADSGNQTLRQISPAGTNWIVSTVAGLAGAAGNRDGAGDAVRFRFPAGLASDSAGWLCVADAANNSVRLDKFVPPALRYQITPGQFVVFWPEAAGGFVLETASAVSGAGGWSPHTNGVVTTVDGFVLTNFVETRPAFWRLRGL